MDFLHWLSGLRNPVLNAVFQAITECGGEMMFLIIGIVMLWCVDKRQGYFILLVGFFGTYINQFLKISCRVPRPWVLDPSFSIVESAREAATGYSFPSGHTQISVGCFAGLAVCRREKWLRAIVIPLAVLVPFSRMYLGVHTPLDVGVSAAIALLLVFGLWFLFKRHGDAPRLMIPLLSALSAFGIFYLLYCLLHTFPADIDPVNLAEALKNAYTLLGCMIGMWTVYLLDRKFIRFNTQAPLLGQILKASLGFLIVLLILEGSKPLWNLALGEDNPLARVLRYALTVIFAGSVWPLTFPRFAKVGRKQEAM